MGSKLAAPMTGAPPQIAELKGIWSQSPSPTAALRKAESHVVGWEWSTDLARWVPEPYYHERIGTPRGHRLKSEPVGLDDVARYGFDVDGLLRVGEIHRRDRTRTTVIATPDQDRALRHIFDERDVLVAVQLYELERGRAVSGYHYSAGGQWTWSEFDYDTATGLPVRMRWGGSPEGFDEHTAQVRVAGSIAHFEHDEQGKLVRIVGRNQLPGEPDLVLYKRRRKGVSRRELARRVADQLTEAVPAAVDSASLREPVWCLALHYDPGAPLPPSVVLGAEPELNPAEWEAARRLELDEPQLLESCAELWSEWGGEDSGPALARRLLNGVAKRLNELDWSDLVSAEEAFFVYAVDLELEDLERNLERSLTRTQLGMLRRRGVV